ncbi:MAG: D-alanyl-D-alanine carboxypeptidase [Proteobacteria bacterium]|nr:D-alanyl-D-alanine carboxypeptidase [Pseudomonadota bacterium]
MKHFFIFFSLLFGLTVSANSLELQAPQAYMIDLETGVVLFDKNAEQKMAPSSMSKIMTAYLVFERLKSGDTKLDDLLNVSKKAWQMEGSRMFVNVDSQVSVENLLKGVVVQSGNDACVVLAEALSGTEAAFAEEMTRKAHEMGATNTTFLNSTGLPDEGHLTTAKDLALIAERTIRDFPEQYAKYYPLKEFEYNNIKQANRNPLFTKNIGADGMKTGFTNAGGYGIVASAKQGNRRIIAVVNGLPSAKAREQDAVALLNWGFNYFKNYKIFAKGDVVDVVDVWGGTEKTIPLVSSQDIIMTLPRNQRKDLQVKVSYDSPLAAPLKAGDQVGIIEITLPGKDVQKIPLHVGKGVDKAWFHQRIGNSISYLLLGKHK